LRPSPAALEAELGTDLWGIIAAIGVPVVEVVPVTTIRWSGSPRASFRLTLADGQVLKGRRLRAPADVTRVAHLSSLLDPRYFPPVLAYRGCALLTRWIPGRPGSPSAWTSTRLRTCGRLQATIHRLHVSPGIASLQQQAPDWTERLDRWLGELVARGALDTHTAREIYRLTALAAPATATAGVCHTDFCGDNIIITDVGRICVVDNEGITLDSLEFDLARTWYRWPMTPAQQRAYADGYGAHAHSARFAAHFLHWALLAVLDSAAYRVRAHAASARVPLDRLTELLHTHGRNESFPRLLSRGGP
jgi:aminoglycoside phosphotransferase (APT) family kinase protein